MINILKVFGKLDPGGAELRTLDLITEVNRRNINDVKFHFLVLRGEKGLLDEKFIEQKGKIHYIKLKDFKFLISFIKLVRKEKINVLYSNVFLFSGVFMLLGRLLNIPVRISHIRTLFDEKENSRRKIRNYFLKKLMYFNSTYIVGVNESVLKRNFPDFLKKEKFKVLYNGIRLPKNQSEHIFYSNSVNIIHIGRQNPAKNHKKLINTFIEINKILPNSKLHLIGKVDKEINDELYIKLKDNGLEDSVIGWGIQDNVYNFLDNKNLLIFPSIREGLPGVILEALASGVPVMASNIEPHLELEKYFTSLTTMEASLSDKEWAEKAIEIIHSSQVLNNKELIKEFSESPFGLSNHVDAYLKLIRKEF